MSERVIRWGMIGAGDVAEVKSGPAFQKVENSQLLALMRRNAEKAADFARRHQVPEWYDDAAQMLEQADINTVYVATPPDSHLEYTLMALEAGKDVYLEKPMAMSAEECQTINKAVAQSGRKLVVAHYRRALPAFQKVKTLLTDGAIGTPKLALLRILQPAESSIIAQTETNWRVQPDVSGGGLFHDIAPHQIDLMLHYFGQPASYTGNALNQAHLYEADDTVTGSIIFENQVIFQGTWCFSVPEAFAQEEVQIIGSEGKITFTFYGSEVHLQQGSQPQTFSFEHPPHIQQPMIEQVVRYFRGEAENPCSGEVGEEVIRIMEGFTV
ncbi:Gfo/Idh/MocA family protein [Tunicatimonas pelagia]|uniref:Gfo/Idh/MocA family protein n=1 Tax=Tunicatimonas pelagia TaxID=931531 RepID=UPI0026653766|nr:Gfo/Idh/MocA family oxidoreductase [Tunicatimonas pelagia]WKN41549.1 Gfo/Idh/MocA family oxidoreductase [Tunicatimonas pelagia]